jgi:hypothetical protein
MGVESEGTSTRRGGEGRKVEKTRDPAVVGVGILTELIL